MRSLISETAALRMAWLRDVAHPSRIAGKLLRALLVLAIAGHVVLILVVLIASLALLRWNPPVTALMAYRGVTAHQKSQPIRFVPLHQIPRVARSMVIRLEDYRFYQHHGVDFGALRDAWKINESIRRTAVGGSTIPMQLARNLFLTPRKTYFRKYVESIIAIEMDFILPKDRILELYLNCIEWGKGVFGIGAASVHYYKTGVGGLGLDEMRRLVTIITNPLRFNVQTFSRSAQMTERYAYLVSRFPDPTSEPPALGPVAPLPDPQPAAVQASPPVPEPAAQPAPVPAGASAEPPTQPVTVPAPQTATQPAASPTAAQQ
jgi:monofunctional biosynthetic peptidoglycan transglycosylase